MKASMKSSMKSFWDFWDFWDILPNEVKILIFQMNPEHRQLFSSSFQELKFKSTLYRLHFIYNAWNQLRSEKNIPLLILFKKYIDDPDHLIRILNTCKCCVRHSKNKPLSLTELGDYNSFSDSSMSSIRPGDFIEMSRKKCKCYCRGYSRRIFDAFDEKNSYLIHSSIHPDWIIRDE